MPPLPNMLSTKSRLLTRLPGAKNRISILRVGLRPGRPEVRVAAEPLDDGRTVVHNYGHGGAGFLLSWGCALDVVAMAAEAAEASPPA